MSARRVAPSGLALALLLASFAGAAHAQRLGSISGSIFSTIKQPGTEKGVGLEGARIALIGTEFYVITNKRGEFAFHGLTPGKYVIQASAIGFTTLSSPIEVKPLETLEVEFEAEPQAARLPDLEVAEAPNLPPEFARRAATGRGRYYSRAEIERRNPPTVADLLRTVPGMRVDCRGPICRAGLMRAPRNCPPSFWLDGIPADPVVVWLQPPRDLDGVEVYSGPAETPPELDRGSSCGAIALWTRQPPRRIPKEKKPKEPVKADTAGVTLR